MVWGVMTIALWILLGLAGAVVMTAASRVAIRHVVALSDKLRVPPFLVGITLVALGTDLPEIVNSVVSSYLGHGDINVGDSVGSVFTQGSLVLGLIPFLTSNVISVNRRDAGLLTGLTVAALLIGAWLMRDGILARFDAAILALVSLAATAVAWRFHAVDPEVKKPVTATGGALRHGGVALLALAAVGSGASGLVHAVIGVSASLGVPEYVASFFGAALGTSLPELVVNLTAMRRGHREIALGGVLGACLLDASISVAVGPFLFPIAVTSSLALRGAVIAAAVMVVAGLTLGLRGKHDRFSGAGFIALYVAAYFLL